LAVTKLKLTNQLGEDIKMAASRILRGCVDPVPPVTLNQFLNELRVGEHTHFGNTAARSEANKSGKQFSSVTRLGACYPVASFKDRGVPCKLGASTLATFRKDDNTSTSSSWV
jgi:hypothetical protein